MSPRIPLRDDEIQMLYAGKREKNSGTIIKIINICHLGNLPISVHNLHLILYMVTVSLESICSKLRNHSLLKIS